jgi:hypothetical protein
VGVSVLGLSVIDVEKSPELWGGPRFDVPILGLRAAGVGEMILAARALFRGRSSVSQAFVLEAAEATGEEAVEIWRCCHEAGDMRRTTGSAGLCTRSATTVRPTDICATTPSSRRSWWGYGRTAQALGLEGEARGAYRRAVDLEDAGGPVTGARARLAELEEARSRRLLGRRDRQS